MVVLLDGSCPSRSLLGIYLTGSVSSHVSLKVTVLRRNCGLCFPLGDSWAYQSITHRQHLHPLNGRKSLQRIPGNFGGTLFPLFLSYRSHQSCHLGCLSCTHQRSGTYLLKESPMGPGYGFPPGSVPFSPHGIPCFIQYLYFTVLWGL